MILTTSEYYFCNNPDNLSEIYLKRRFNEFDERLNLNVIDDEDFRKEIHYDITDGKTVYGTMKIVLIDHLFELVSDNFPFYDSHSQVLHDLYVEMIGNEDIYFRYLHFLDRLEIDEKYAFDWNNIFLKYSESNQNYKETRSSGWGNDSIIFTQIGMLNG